MQRRTKIVATIGPASEDESTLAAMIGAGMDVARINLAHSTIDSALDLFHRIRQLAEDAGSRIGILVDLPGPKVRAASFGEPGVEISAGSSVELRIGNDASDDSVIEVDYEGLLTDIHVADRITVGDGQLTLEIANKSTDKLIATVSYGGLLRGRPGFTFRPTGCGWRRRLKRTFALSMPSSRSAST